MSIAEPREARPTAPRQAPVRATSLAVAATLALATGGCAQPARDMASAADLGGAIPPAALGRPPAAAERAAYAATIYADGRGLPAGRGDAAAGEGIYPRACQRCHGARGSGGSGGDLAGRDRLDEPDADRTIGAYWPFATTVFDYIRRAMPLDAPRTLDDDAIYSVTAYLLYLNGIVGRDDVLDAGTLARVRMPNAAGFVGIDAPWPDIRPRIEPGGDRPDN